MIARVLRLLLGRWFLVGRLGGRLRVWRKRALPDFPEVFLTGKELAEHFDVSDRTVRRWRAEGMPSLKSDGGARRYPQDACEAWAFRRD